MSKYSLLRKLGGPWERTATRNWEKYVTGRFKNITAICSDSTMIDSVHVLDIN